MAARPAARWLRTLASPVRTAGLAGAALLLGAGGALAATGTDVALVSPTAHDTVTVDEPVEPDAPAQDATTDATDDDSAATEDSASTEDAATEDAPPEATSQEDPATVVSCEDAANHGEYVSSVAHATAPGPGHGIAVREAAHSDCGFADTTDDEATTDDDAVAPENQREKTAKQDRHHGNSKANARAHARR